MTDAGREQQVFAPRGHLPNRNRARIGAPLGQGCAGAKPAPGPRNMVLAWHPLSTERGLPNTAPVARPNAV